jgi:transposase InsO family protein
VANCFKKFAKRAQNEFEVKIKKIRSDNGKEFDNTNIEAYCDEIRIKHEVSSTYTPQQNGVVERKTWTLITLARTILDEYNTPENYGPRKSTPHAMLQIASSYKSFLARPSISC